MTAETGTWIEVLAGRHPCRVFEPAVPGDHGYVAIYLHELPPDPLLEDPAFTRVWARSGLRVACPLAGPCWWTDRICPAFDPEQSGERHVLEAVGDLVRDRWSAEPPRVAVCGVGMGGQGALRLAYRYPNRFPVVAAISPELDFHQLLRFGDSSLRSMYPDPEAARQDTALLQIQTWNGPRQQWFCCAPDDYRRWDSADRLRMKLSSLGVRFECDLETSGDEPLDYYLAMLSRAADFLVAGLDRERLRLA